MSMQIRRMVRPTDDATLATRKLRAQGAAGKALKTQVAELLEMARNCRQSGPSPAAEIMPQADRIPAAAVLASIISSSIDGIRPRDRRASRWEHVGRV